MATALAVTAMVPLFANTALAVPAVALTSWKIAVEILASAYALPAVAVALATAARVIAPRLFS